MKNNSTTIGYILILALFLGFLWFNNDTVEEMEKQQAQAQQDSIAQAEAEAAAAPPDTASIQEIVAIEETVKKDFKTFSLENDLLKVELQNLLQVKKELTTTSVQFQDTELKEWLVKLL